MPIPTQLNRTQFHELLSRYTGNPNIHYSRFQKALKGAGVHKEVMYGAHFGREKATKILSTVKEHLESSYKEKGFGIRGRGKLFQENPEDVYRQHVRKLAQNAIAAQNKAQTDAARQQATQTQAQKRAQEVRQRLRNVPAPTTPALSQPVLAKEKDESIVPASPKVWGKLYGEGIAALTGTARPEQDNPTFFETARRSSPNTSLSPAAAVNPLDTLTEEEDGPEKNERAPRKIKDDKLPDTSAVDRGLPL